MDTPPSSAGKCPQCGALLPIDAAQCWVCGDTSQSPTDHSGILVPIARTKMQKLRASDRWWIHAFAVLALAIGITLSIVWSGIIAFAVTCGATFRWMFGQ